MTCGGPMSGAGKWQQRSVDVPGSRVEEECGRRGLDRRRHSSLDLSGSSCTYSISLKPTLSEFWSTRAPLTKIPRVLRGSQQRGSRSRRSGNRKSRLFASILSRHFVYNHSTGCRPRAVALNSSDRFLPDTHLCRRRLRPPSRPMASLKQI